jgi:hypothetical protein
MKSNKNPIGEDPLTPKTAKRHADRRNERLWATASKKEGILFYVEKKVKTSIQGVTFKKVKLEQLKVFLHNLKVAIPNKQSDKNKCCQEEHCDYIWPSKSSHESVLGAMLDSPMHSSLLLNFPSR